MGHTTQPKAAPRSGATRPVRAARGKSSSIVAGDNAPVATIWLPFTTNRLPSGCSATFEPFMMLALIGTTSPKEDIQGRCWAQLSQVSRKTESIGIVADSGEARNPPGGASPQSRYIERISLHGAISPFPAVQAAQIG